MDGLETPLSIYRNIRKLTSGIHQVNPHHGYMKGRMRKTYPILSLTLAKEMELFSRHVEPSEHLSDL